MLACKLPKKLRNTNISLVCPPESTYKSYQKLLLSAYVVTILLLEQIIIIEKIIIKIDCLVLMEKSHVPAKKIRFCILTNRHTSPNDSYERCMLLHVHSLHEDAYILTEQNLNASYCNSMRPPLAQIFRHSGLSG